MRDFNSPGRSPVYATNGMVATSHPLAASTALNILRQGGSAADAAIAGAVILGLCEPHMCGIGGDMFALVKPAGSEDIIALNASGKAPAGFDAAALRNQGITKIDRDTAAAVTVPGAVDGFATLSERFGKLGLDACLAPAIDAAKNGVPVAPRVATDWADCAANLSPTAAKTYLLSGVSPATGQVFRHEGTARALEAIAAHGRDGFYKGPVAEDMVAALSSAGGAHTLDDFAATKSDWGTPIAGTYKGTDLVEHPPNGQGATAILLANILSSFDLAAFAPNSADRIHIEMEATKLAYDARNRILADPDHTARLAHMTSPETARKLAAKIQMSSAMADAKPLTEEVHRDTVLITAVDADGMAVTLIYSIFASFGSGIAGPDFGILMHNRGAGFTLEAGHPNEAAPGKRPMHTIIPAMLRQNDRVTMAFGVMGGQYQATGHAHVLTNLIDYGMDPQEALDSPRAFTEAGELRLERGFSDDVASDLEARGHTIVRPELPIGGGQAIAIDHQNGTLIGASDPRKDGCAIGY